MYIYILIIQLFVAFVISLPISNHNNKNEHTIETIIDPNGTSADLGNFQVQVDRLVELIATHLQFDHLDAVISNTDKEIAMEFQHHIQINVESTVMDTVTMTSTSSVHYNDNLGQSNILSHDANNNQYAIQQLPTLDMMDLEILKSQIFAAIQAHTEGNLPLTWDKVADKLSRHSIEQYLRTSILSKCRHNDYPEDIVLSTCLNDHASDLAADLDTYIEDSLINVFEALDKEALPKLLKHTAEDLRGILKYFNSVFLQGGNRRFTLEVIPWNEDANDIHSFKSRLLNIAIHHDSSEVSHSLAFFEEYAKMARN